MVDTNKDAAVNMFPDTKNRIKPNRQISPVCQKYPFDKFQLLFKLSNTDAFSHTTALAPNTSLTQKNAVQTNAANINKANSII